MVVITMIRAVRMTPNAYDNGKAILAIVSDPKGGTGVRKGYHRCEPMSRESCQLEHTHLYSSSGILNSTVQGPKFKIKRKKKTYSKGGILLHDNGLEGDVLRTRFFVPTSQAPHRCRTETTRDHLIRRDELTHDNRTARRSGM